MAANRSKDYYATLGVPRNAKADAIRTAYRHLARKLHPDVNPGDKAAEERFKDVQEAYDILSSEEKRGIYDRYGFYSEQARQQASAGQGFGFEGFDFSDLGRQGSGGANLSDLFEGVFGGGRGRGAPARRPGEDLEYEMEISFDGAIRGSTERLKVSRQARCAACSGSGNARGEGQRTCTTCGGTGQSHRRAGNMRFSVPCAACDRTGQVRTPCAECSGEGRVPMTDTIDVRIPPGTRENARLRLQGKGNAGILGGGAGDLYIIVHVGKHALFRRDGFDIHIQVPITPAEAVLGAKIAVPTIDGTAHMRVPPATSSGKTFRMRERGVPDPRSKRRGDQFVRIAIVVPEIPDESTKDLMRRYAELNPKSPRDSPAGGG
ncbi:MAG: molecular chaperone DnaJ [Bryobacterales bacterium]|nr:molecular chaperone DnaJ [Bryobacterales bacterium]